MVLNVTDALKPQRLTDFFFFPPKSQMENMLGFQSIGNLLPNYLTLPLFKRAAMIPEEMRWLFQQNLTKQVSRSGFRRPTLRI